jgi:hypothetical protein
MDLKIKEDIQFIALSIFSESLVKARQRIETMHEQLRNPKTNSIIKATLHNNLRGSIQAYDSFRIKQAKKKQEVLQTLFTKYPGLDQGEIERCLDSAVNEYEVIERDSNAQVYNSIDEYTEITIPVYSRPTKQDMAVLLVYFNACSYKKLAQNLCLIYQTLTRAGIPVFLLEHCFGDQVPLFPENGTTIFNTRSESYMFYKENLLNWLMPKVPAQYTKFFMMDCDLLFEKPTWYNDVSQLLDKYDVVQPFQFAVWLDSDLKGITLKREGVVYINSLGEKPNLGRHHPGFAWAFRREFIEPKGIYDLNVLGSGDTVIGAAVLQKSILSDLWKKNSSDWILENCADYYKLFEDTKVTFYSQSLYHLWHGSRKNREYHTNNNNRYQLFHNVCLEHTIVAKDELFILNSNNLYEFNPSIRDKMNNILLTYFQSRQEDGI